MELMITKLLSLDHGVQLIGMSATLSNPKLLADWMQAKFYVSKFRPIPISEYLVYDNSIYSTRNTKDFFSTLSQLNGTCATQKPPSASQTIEVSIHKELENAMNNAVVALAVETATNDYGALVFCSSRQGSQTMAGLISQAMPPVAPETLDKRMDVLAALQALPGGFESTFSKTIISGVGFHHAGLTMEEREIAAEAYDHGILQVMAATCSLAAGLNLPARRVILNGARMGRDLVGPAMLRQMRGRAGRKGKDEVGESYLCCQKKDLEAVADLLEAELPPVESCLTPEKRGVKRALLEVIAIRLATTRDSINDYIHRSLLWQTTNHSEVLVMVDVAMEDLITTELIQQTEYGNLEPTKLGSAIVAASLTPEDGIFVHNNMLRAIQSFVMDGEMHIFYLFTPLQISDPKINWQAFRAQLDSLDDSALRALLAIGISPALVNRIVTSGADLPLRTPAELTLARIYARAYAAFQLRDICNEVPLHRIAAAYDVPRGSVQNLAQSCHGFAAGMVKFCSRMGWGMLAAVLEHMLDRLRAGARADLLEMSQVVFVKSRMARILWENGFKSVRALAEARVEDLVPVMMMAQGRRKGEGDWEEKLRGKLREKAEVIVGSAGRLWERQMMVELEE
jgi:replicative superfamily II helicase